VLAYADLIRLTHLARHTSVYFGDCANQLGVDDTYVTLGCGLDELCIYVSGSVVLLPNLTNGMTVKRSEVDFLQMSIPVVKNLVMGSGGQVQL